MLRLLKFLQFSLADKQLLLHSLLTVAWIRLALSVLPFRIWQPLLASLTPPPAASATADPGFVQHVVWAVRSVSRLVPAATCLTQALATRVLLRRYGVVTRLQIGVLKDAQGQFHAHAWVEYRGSVIIGGSDSLGQYSVLPPLKR
ncbi:MAG: lasso peptide biosynthesis B2 protein [Oscillochloris sp.]|nr:lasso peptide biosynthesis B2 protein [Oscillochloris sp.]